MAARPVRAELIAYLYVGNEAAGYVVVPASGGSVSVNTLQPDRQDSAPNPGPTMSVRLAVKGQRAGFAARVAPASGVARAARVAAALSPSDR